jgi:hypothetical protein
MKGIRNCVLKVHSHTKQYGALREKKGHHTVQKDKNNHNKT